MANSTPVVYILHGEDEFSIAQTVSEIEAKLGDSAFADMNRTRLDGRSFNLDELLSVAGPMPFLADRRVVVLSHPLAQIKTSTARKKFLGILEKVPETTALVLIEYGSLTEDRDRRRNKLHWLERWAGEHSDLVWIRQYSQPKGPEVERRIQDLTA